MNLFKNIKKRIKLHQKKHYITNKALYTEIQLIKKMLILHEINNKALSYFIPEPKPEFNEEGLLYKTLSFNNMPLYENVKDAFLIETAELKICELSNSGQFDNIVKIVTDFFKLIDAVSDKYNDKKYELIEKLHGEIAFQNSLEGLDLFFEHVSKKYSDITKYFTIAHISYLLYKKNYEKADDLLKQYLKRYGKKDLPRYAPVANFAYKKGIKSKNIKIASIIFEEFEKGVNNNLFEKYIKDKKVAIVGNGPQELNTGNGKKIDSYDEVIRFNQFDTDKEDHSADYGQKVTIWSKNGYASNQFNDNVNVHIVRCNLYFMPLANKINEYSHYINKNKIFVWFPDELYKEIKEKFNINSPTGGFQMVYWVKKINDQLTKDDCYGFSFKDNSDACAHYFGPETQLSSHSWNREQMVLNQLFK